MDKIKLLLGEVARQRGDGMYAKVPRVAYVDGVYMEVYPSNSGQEINLLSQRDKGAFDDAKLNIAKVGEDLSFAQNQVAKIEKEIARGEEGRRGDLVKYQEQEAVLKPKVAEMERILKNPDTEIIKFDLEDCI